MTMGQPKIRQATEADVEKIREIAREAWRPIYDYFREQMGDDLWTREHPGDPLDRKADTVEKHFREHPDWGFVTELEGEVVAFCTYMLGEEGIGVIGNNAVDPAGQGKGIGTAQYEECLQRMRDAGMDYVKVQTGLDPTHAPARRAYEKVGFEAIRPSVQYYMEL